VSFGRTLAVWNFGEQTTYAIAPHLKRFFISQSVSKLPPTKKPSGHEKLFEQRERVENEDYQEQIRKSRTRIGWTNIR